MKGGSSLVHTPTEKMINFIFNLCLSLEEKEKNKIQITQCPHQWKGRGL